MQLRHSATAFRDQLRVLVPLIRCFGKITALLLIITVSTPAANTLDIYFIDVEGGGSYPVCKPNRRVYDLRRRISTC